MGSGGCGGAHQAHKYTVTTKRRKKVLEVQLHHFLRFKGREEDGPLLRVEKKVDLADVGAEVPGSSPGPPATTSTRILLAATS